MEDKKKNTIIGILSAMVIMLLSFIIYITFFKLERIEDTTDYLDSITKYVDTYEKMVGTYEYNNDKKIVLIINEDGTGEYRFEDECGESTCTYDSVKGMISIGKNMVYLINNNCEKTLIGNDCVYPNCRLIYEFSIKDDKAIIDEFTLIKR